MMPLAGDPDALLAAAEQLDGAARDLGAVHETMGSHARSITADWSGLAAPLALARIDADAEDVRRAADTVASVVGPLRSCAEELRAAQRDAEAAGSAARALAANEAAARAFRAASDALGGPVPATAPQGSAGIGSALAGVGNVAASLGNAALHHVPSALAVVGGGALAAVSAAGVLGGTVATATGVGAPVGVPLTGASAAGVAAGVGLAGAGTIDLTQHALGDDRVAPFRVDEETGARGWPVGSVPERVVSAGEAGRSRRVRVLESEEEVGELYDELAANGEPLERSTYDGPWRRLPDGTEIGLREESFTGGRTLDARLPNGERWRIHVRDR